MNLMMIPLRRRPEKIAASVEEAREYKSRNEPPYMGPKGDSACFLGDVEGAEPAQ